MTQIFTTQTLELWQNSNSNKNQHKQQQNSQTQILTKLKNFKRDKIKELKFWQKFVTKIKKLNFKKTLNINSEKPQFLTKL